MGLGDQTLSLPMCIVREFQVAQIEKAWRICAGITGRCRKSPQGKYELTCMLDVFNALLCKSGLDQYLLVCVYPAVRVWF